MIYTAFLNNVLASLNLAKHQAFINHGSRELSDLLFINLIAHLNMDMATFWNWAWLQISFERLRSWNMKNNILLLSSILSINFPARLLGVRGRVDTCTHNISLMNFVFNHVFTILGNFLIFEDFDILANIFVSNNKLLR
jgi:hypothetical protein